MKAAQSSEALGSEHGRLELDLVANMRTPAAAGLHHLEPVGDLAAEHSGSGSLGSWRRDANKASHVSGGF
jgi:hypothetical protein